MSKMKKQKLIIEMLRELATIAKFSGMAFNSTYYEGRICVCYDFKSKTEKEYLKGQFDNDYINYFGKLHILNKK